MVTMLAVAGQASFKKKKNRCLCLPLRLRCLHSCSEFIATPCNLHFESSVVEFIANILSKCSEKRPNARQIQTPPNSFYSLTICF